MNYFKFLIRREVLITYKSLVKTINEIEDKDYKQEILKWTREDFKRNKKLTDNVIFLFYFILI